MRITLSQSTYALRDAGEVAFGLVAMGILMALAAMLGGAVLAAAWWYLTGQPATGLQGWGATSVVMWLLGMGLVLRHYRRATRGWVEERRGGDMLFLVECIASVAGAAAAWWLGPSMEGLVYAVRASLGAFLVLLVLAHAVTYALLAYRPRVKELLLWGAIAAAVGVELVRKW